MKYFLIALLFASSCLCNLREDEPIEIVVLPHEVEDQVVYLSLLFNSKELGDIPTYVVQANIDYEEPLDFDTLYTLEIKETGILKKFKEGKTVVFNLYKGSIKGGELIKSGVEITNVREIFGEAQRQLVDPSKTQLVAFGGKLKKCGTGIYYLTHIKSNSNTDYNHVFNAMLVYDIGYEDGSVVTLDRVNDEQHRLVANTTYDGKIRVPGSETEDDISIKSVSEIACRKENDVFKSCDAVEAF